MLSRLNRLWYQRILPWFVTRLFIGQVNLRGGGDIPATGPLLFLGLHKAGMMDAYVYARALSRPVTFVVAARLLRSRLLCPLVSGIAVARQRDGDDTAQNHAALAHCAERLEAGEAVVLFPEGTSTLGPRPLPFAPGAAHLARACPNALIVPMTLRYHDPTLVGTAVDVVVGVPFRLPAGATREQARAMVTQALEAVNDAYPPHKVLIQLRHGRPLHALMVAINVPPALAAWFAARKFADDDTAVLTMKMLGALAVLPLWSFLLVGGLAAAKFYGALLLYLALAGVFVASPGRT